MTLRSSQAALAWSPAAGERSEYGRWHDPETPVCWASVTKVFVAGVTRALVERGDLDWSTPAGALLGVDAPMTLAALVEHRSGLPRALPEQKATLPDPYAEWTTEHFDSSVLPRLPELATTTDDYSNVGYAVLGRALERHTGTDWLTLVRDLIVAPLGLPGADFTVDAPVTAGGPIPVSLDLRGRPVAEWDTSTGPFSAAGGLCASLPTMHAVLRAAVEQGGPLLPGDGPHAWVTTGQRSWHSGALFRSGSLAVVDTGTGAVAVAHALGGAPGMGSRHAEKALGTLLEAAA